MLYRYIRSEAPQWGQCGDKRGNWGGTRLIPDCAVRWSAFMLRLCSLLGCTGNSDKLQELFWNYYKEQKQDQRVRGKVWEGKRDAGEKGAERRISSTRLTFLSSVVFFGQPSLALGTAVQAVIWHRSFAWPFCIPCYLISSTRNKQETCLQGLYMYVNGADDETTTLPLCSSATVGHFHSLFQCCSSPTAWSVFPLPALKWSQAPAQPRLAGCRSGFASSDLKGRWALCCVAGLEKALQLEQRHCSKKFLQGRNAWMFLISRKLLVIFVGWLPKIYYACVFK